ncbi:hypothetical protein OGR47_13250 [Methylocystis sp. MJC1]|uniref:hypothetical protein n=1 Tax=Methylocystis sp. MJC1 TaxID=2654282 RepID=UPI0013EA7B5C|nr:hypothetical protein [Methylocystis sp. MJC1]KAF2989471.1 hypothetical protein MJC1_03446 [Methylocystis sp. MJC1]MBU6527938.1 hypothetical protein [Methylocystis sp. MJC1]UZX10858.1 hypothetical protein OGR47_13250 [Methylocystis sp. MJC1]
MKIKSVFFATLVAGGVVAAAPLASAMTLAPLKAPGVAPQTVHSVMICEHGRCFWTRNHWGYGGGDHWGYGGGWRGDRWGYGGGWRRDHWRDRDYDGDRDWR